MRAPSPLLLALLPPVLLACSDASSAAPPGNDGGTSTFTYTPAGCSYSYAPPSTLGFTDVSLDDTGAVSASQGVPARVRLGLGGGVTKTAAGSYADPTKNAAFTWETAESNHAAKLRYGTSAGAMSTVQTGYTWSTPGSLGGTATYMHEVHVCGLKPGTHYFYQVGGGPSGKEVWSATQDFTTVPDSGTVTLGVFGDARDTKTTWQLVHERMREAQVAMQLIDGDIVDAAAIEQNYTDWLDEVWKDPSGTGFLTLGQQMMVPINGNHENDHANSFAAWAIPGVAGDPYAETYASFDVGSAHVVMIDDLHISSQTGGTTDPVATKQLAWLDADLTAAEADRTKHPFIIALSHRGMFSTSLHSGDADVLAVRGALGPLFDKHKVDLAINGHDHEYERSLPLHVNASNPMSNMVMPGTGGTSYTGAEGTTYVICAGAGAEPYATGKSKPNYAIPSTQTSFCTAGPTCMSYIGVYSILTLASNKLTLTAYGLKASSTSIMTDTVIDTVNLTPQ